MATTQCGLPAFLPHLKEFYNLGHNLVICCDDTLLFNTHISAELFEYAKAVGLYELEDLKAMLIRNVDAIFLDSEEFKNELKAEIKDKY